MGYDDVQESLRRARCWAVEGDALTMASVLALAQGYAGKAGMDISEEVDSIRALLKK